ncbi:MAG: hypothetical protein HRT89_19500 [Lentisphaeria bacterium]|nr:hypothetical protein [Lentisphaeria bacterium]NQZ70243.1 hypothetical protein [Lentisphaeria bacterium]
MLKTIVTYSLFLLISHSLIAGTINTLTGSVQGTLVLQPSGVKAGNQTRDWAQVLSVIWQRQMTASSANAIRMRNGEIWYGKVLGIRKNRLKILIEPFGEKDIDLQLIEMIEFQPGGKAGLEMKPGKLYKKNGHPVTGLLGGINRHRVQVNTALGKLILKRQEVLAYVCNKPDFEELETDEIGLANKSVFRGKLTLEKDALVLEHATLGKARFATGALAYIRRHQPGIERLKFSAWKLIKRQGPLNRGPLPKPLTYTAAGLWTQATEITAGTTLRLSKSDSMANAKLSVLVCMTEQSKTALVLRASAGGKEISKKVLKAGSPPHYWSFPVSNADIDITVEYDKLVKVPCTVVFGDPVIRKNK